MVKHFETSKEKDIYLSTIRQKAFQEVDTIANKPRFALFSQPPPLAVSDNSYDHVFNIKRNEMGKPETQPRNVQTNITKQGKTKSSYFKEMGYISIGDKYQDQYKLQKLDEMQKKSKIPKDIPQFRYSSGYKQIIKHPYEHKSDYQKVNKVYRDENGRVIINQRNPQTSQIVKGLYKQPEYMKDEYNRYDQTVTKARLDHQAKIKELPPFKNMEHGKELFNSMKEIYYDDPNLKQKEKKELDLKAFQHDVPFKPSHPTKQGYNKSIGKYPQYMENPIKDLVRKFDDPDTKKDVFKLNYPNKLEQPTPSISFHSINIKREMRRSIH